MNAPESIIVVRVISLASSVERRANMARGLADFPLPWSFFDAFSEAREEGPQYDESRAVAAFGRTLSRQEIGCFHSHFGVMKAFLDDSAADWLLVLEDDLLVDSRFDFAALIDHLETSGLDCLRLYCRRWKHADLIGAFGYRQLLRFRTDPYGIQSYLINKRATAAVLGNITEIRRPFDDELARFWEHGVPIVALFPFPVLETSTVSTIDAGRERESRDRRVSGLEKLQGTAMRLRDKVAKVWFNLGRRPPRRGGWRAF